MELASYSDVYSASPSDNWLIRDAIAYRMILRGRQQGENESETLNHLRNQHRKLINLGPHSAPFHRRAFPPLAIPPFVWRKIRIITRATSALSLCPDDPIVCEGQSVANVLNVNFARSLGVVQSRE